MIIKGARVYTSDFKFTEKIIITGDTLIERVMDEDDCVSDFMTCESNSENVIDASGLLAIPGLVDIHFHGAMGHDFCDADCNGLKEIAKYEATHGITAICPATMTFSEEILGGIMEKAGEFVEDYNEAKLVGINMEGPFISPEKIGAQNPAYLMNPDTGMFKRLQKKSGNQIKLVDIAPELPGSFEFIRELEKDVNISIAHTNCDYDTAIKAFDLGACHVTHLFNAMPLMSHRLPGPVCAAMEKQAEVELIADGIHVHPAMVRFVFNTFSEEKIILISDSMEATGLPDGDYQLGGQAVKVIGKKAVLANNSQTIAGSVTNLYDCMVSAVKMGISKEAAIRAATINPAKAIGIEDRYGMIKKGAYANILLVDEELNIKYIINRGKIIYSTAVCE
ncbi:MAG: N-acetylglucosamine-6-phosphate deacetylase [Butyrivibrio sp.]|nr:N-acetylglucosamine-6-phosphate deacetylase [Butyrivibrio sp.]